MTNFEWIKSDNKRLKKFLIHGIAAYKGDGKARGCTHTSCALCSFNDIETGSKPCHLLRKEWLEKEHGEPLYKRGDIVVFIPSKKHPEETRIGVVSKDECNGIVLLTWNISNIERHLDVVDDIDGIECNVEDVLRKISNIEEE